MNTVNFSMVATKYLYINNETITGNDSNDDTGTGNGVTYNNPVKMQGRNFVQLIRLQKPQLFIR